MDKKNRSLAIDLLVAKRDDPSISYADIARKTGYSGRQLMRIAKRIAEGGAESAATHGNAGRKPATTATEDEVRYLRELKKPYECITIAQFRDIFIEDVIENPDKRDDVERYGLVARSKSWFRELFLREGWRSPAQKPARRHAGRVSHPIRDPMPRRGMLVQVDGTPYDWLGDGRTQVLHLAVDDATTDALAGCFMPLECMRGYARMAERMVRSRGVPEAIYSDKHSVFVSKDGGSTQFSMMMSDLGVRMVFASTPQAKGRVERYNLTSQLRLVNDIIRFGIGDYDQLDSWFNEFYVEYLNRKFSFPPREGASEFRALADDFDYTSVFRIRLTRIARGGMISYEMGLYWMVGDGGELYDPGEGVRVSLYIDVWTEAMYVERYGRRYACVLCGVREHKKPGLAGNQRELQDLLKKMRGDG